MMTKHLVVIVILVVIYMHLSFTIKVDTSGYNFRTRTYYENKNIPSIERQALHDFYVSTNGEDWIYQDGDEGHWNFTDPDVNPCSSLDPWQGLNCTVVSSDSSSNYYCISEIKLSDYNLRGTIPESVGNFSELFYLDLSFNYLYGSLPTTIYELTNLQYFDVENNNFKDILSNDIQRLYNLQHLDIRRNKFYGDIPVSIGNLTKLNYFRISFNEFSGKLPTSLRYLIKLNLFSVNVNQFIGTLPYWIGDLQLMKYLSFDSNYFINTIPSSISKLTSLITLHLGNNNLTGSIPDWIGSLSKLQSLLLEVNYFIGTIPSSLSNLQLLTKLSFSNNSLIGTIPSFIGELKHLTNLTLDNNYFSGSIPSSLGKLSNLLEFDLSSNLLTGTIPDIFHNITDLDKIQLDSNQLAGTLPISIATLSNLTRLFVQNNNLYGDLKNVFNSTNQRNLINIQLSNNQFTGELPEQLFLSSSLVAVSAVGNCFHGTIPSRICMNDQLVSLALDGLVCASSCQTKILPGISSSYISSRSITGGIPDCLWSMPKLKVLHLSGKSLTGSLPSELFKKNSSLLDLSLSYNLLTGDIPSNFQEKSFKNNLDLSFNRLSGYLLLSFNTSYYNSSLSLNNNRLSGFIPKQVHNMKNINILEGSYYDCKYDRSDLPSNDKNKDRYECGSFTVNVLYYILVGLIGFTIFALVFMWIKRDTLVELSHIIEKMQTWVDAVTFRNFNNTNMEIDGNIMQALVSMKYFRRYMETQAMLRKLSFYSTIFIVMIILPFYLTLNHFFHTHYYEYAWTVAIIYVSGKIAFGMTMCLMILFISSQSYIYLKTVKQNFSHEYMRYSFVQKDHEQENTQIPDNASRVWFIYFSYLVINLIVVGGVNIAYIIAILYQRSNIIEIIQILFSIFNLIWNNFISPLMVRWIIRYLSIKTIETQRTFFFLQIVVSISNNIIVPCVLVMIISPNCFYRVFQRNSDVVSSFHYDDCALTNIYGECIQYVTITSTTSYRPPFTYSYQCSADFITYYAPVFVFVCIISTFIIPLIQFVWIKWKLPKILLFSNLYYPSDEIQVKSLVSIDEVFELLVFQITFIGLILTYGTIFPPLAVAYFITICSSTYNNQVIMGRFITNAVQLKAYTQLKMLDKNLKVQPMLATLQKCGWFLLYVSCCFYTLFLFDILGDSVGFYEAYWVLIVMPCVPLCIHVFVNIYTWIHSIYSKKNTNQTKSVDGIQLTSSPPIVSNPLTLEVEVEVDRESSIIDLDASDRHGSSITILSVQN